MPVTAVSSIPIGQRTDEQGKVFLPTVSFALAVPFAPNATVAIGGDLAETVAAAKRNWTTVAASCANLPKVVGAYQARLADDGSFQVREETGLLLIVR